MLPVLALKRQWKIFLSSPPIPWTCLAHKTGSSIEMPGLMETRTGKSAVDSLISQGISACLCPQIPSASGTHSCEFGGEPESLPVLRSGYKCIRWCWGQSPIQLMQLLCKGDGTEGKTLLWSYVNYLQNLKNTSLSPCQFISVPLARQ